MKLMVVGHPFLLAYNQQKYVAMKRLNPDLQLRLVVPNRGCDRFHITNYEIHPELSNDEIVPLKAYFFKSHMTYLHSPRRLAKTLRNFQPDMIHIEEEPQAFITLQMLALRRLFAPRALISLFTWDNILRPRRFPLGIAKRSLRAYSLRRTSMMVCGNRESAAILRTEGYFKGKIEVLPQYGLDLAEHAPGTEPELRKQLGIEGAPVIGYIGQMVERKGLRLLFEALKSLVDLPWKLLLVGSGPLDSEIRDQWTAKLAGRIVTVPAVPYEQVSRYFRCLDIFALPSQTIPTWKEQFGLALAQAMMSGVACIGSDSGAIPEVLGPGGLIFPERDGSQLLASLRVLLESPATRKQFADQGRQFALQHYTRKIVASRYMDAFENVRAFHSRGHEASGEALKLGSVAGQAK